jgi:hypothetical protein
MKKILLAFLLLALFQSCKKENEIGFNNSLSYTVIDTAGNAYSFSDYVSDIQNTSGVTKYFFNNNNSFSSVDPEVVIIYYPSPQSTYFTIRDEASMASNIYNSISISAPDLVNNNVQISDKETPVSIKFQLNTTNNNYTSFSSGTLSTNCTKNSNSTVSGSFNLVLYTGTGTSHYTISGQFTNAKFVNN